MKIDFVSDITCPWCAIGLHSLEQALARLPAELPVELHFQPFELNPQLGPGGEDIALHLSRKYGIDRAQVERNHEAIRERGAAVGFRFDWSRRTKTFNSFDAHRLLHWADVVDPTGTTQRALKHALLKAHFTDGEDTSDAEVLARIAADAGLDRQAARQILQDGRYAEEVREREAFYQGHGIHAVPAVIIDGRHLIQGGQPPEVFEQALRDLAEA
jgi:predicted DsbA family dithiol-disulfide isomerase